MSYSFSVNSSSKDGAKAAVAAAFDEQVLKHQPIHARDKAAALANANAAIDLLADDEGMDVYVSCSGYLSWSGSGDLSEVTVQSTSISASASLARRQPLFAPS